jgi:N-methylhydantoinase B/acetone carboxylase, alpha subunit
VNPEGEVVAQAEHIPVHLGSFRVGVRNLLNWLDEEGVELNQGDVVLLNDPYISRDSPKRRNGHGNPFTLVTG